MAKKKNERFNQERKKEWLESKISEKLLFDGATASDEFDAKLRVSRQGQEMHFANHALIFLLFMARKSAMHQHVRLCLVARCLHHLMNLREFIPEGDLNLTVSALYHAIQTKYEKALSPAGRFAQGGLRYLVRHSLRSKRRMLYKLFEGVLSFIAERQTKKKVYMAEWLNEHQPLIIKFAQAYQKDALFAGWLDAK